jgi:hypothetical protein
MSMSLEQLESQVMALPIAERRAFTRWLDDHRDEIEQPSALTDAQEAEVRQRLAEMEAHPSLRVSCTESEMADMLKELVDARTAKTPSRPR